MMDLEIDEDSSEPVYEQIVRLIQLGAQQGRLAAGMALPSIRQLASDLALNHNTVAKAYKILESKRVIRTAGQKGTFIHSEAASYVEQHNQIDALALMRELVTRLREQGMTVKQIQAAFKAALTS